MNSDSGLLLPFGAPHRKAEPGALPRDKQPLNRKHALAWQFAVTGVH
jgi:hypothetical protein